MVKSFGEYLKSLGIRGWLLMGLSLFTALGAFEFYTDIPALQNFPTWGWLLFLIICLLLAPYWVFRKQKHMIETLSQKPALETTRELFTIESGEYEFGSSDTPGYPQLDVRRILRIDLLINAIPSTWVQAIQLKLLNNMIGTNWHPDYVGGGAPTGGYYYFGIPDSIEQGRYIVKLIAYVEDKIPESKPFEIEVPK